MAEHEVSQEAPQQATQSAAPQQNPTTPTGGESLGWRAGLPKDYQNHEAFTRYGKVGDLAKDYLELRDRSQRAIVIPTQDSKPEEWADYYKRIGRPESADGYEIGPQDHQGLKTLRQAAHDAGMSVEQFKKFIGRLGTDVQGMTKAQKEAHQKRLADLDKGLKTEWGDKYETQRELAVRAYKSLVDEDAAKEFEGLGLLNHPAFIKAMAKAGGALGEGRFVKGGAATASSSPFIVNYDKTKV